MAKVSPLDDKNISVIESQTLQDINDDIDDITSISTTKPLEIERDHLALDETTIKVDNDEQAGSANKLELEAKEKRIPNQEKRIRTITNFPHYLTIETI